MALASVSAIADDSAQLSQRAKFWANELGSDNYFQRERASSRLTEMGEPAIGALTTRACQRDLEAAERSVKILSRFLQSNDLEKSFAAYKALQTVGKSRESLVAGRAWSAIISMQPQAVERIETVGGEFSYDQSTLRLGAEYTGGKEGLIWLRFLWVTKTVRIQKSQLSETDFKSLQFLPNLNEVVIDGYPLTDSGLTEIAKVNNLKVLHVAGADITSQAVAILCKRHQLEWLDLSDTPVDDAVVESLLLQKELEGLELTDSQISESAAVKLRNAMPRTKVLH